MPAITDQHVDFILQDLAKRGIVRDDLRDNLLDHICCLLEAAEWEEDAFETAYEQTLRRFYRHRLSEIEDETTNLLTYKNYYAMKKIMLFSGLAATLALSAGIVLKFLHMPGAAAGIVTGTLLFSLLFLPLMLVLRLRERKDLTERLMVFLSALTGILISMGILFKLMHWPGANVMGLTSVGILVLLFLPVYLVTGLRNPDARLNTIVSSVLIVCGSALFLSLARSPYATRMQYIQNTGQFVRSQRILEAEARQVLSASAAMNPELRSLRELCASLRSAILQFETGLPAIGDDYAEREAFIGDDVITPVLQDAQAARQYSSLREAVEAYNRSLSEGLQALPLSSTVLENPNVPSTVALNDLTQIEMIALQNARLSKSGS
jgi:hypothetical protein